MNDSSRLRAAQTGSWSTATQQLRSLLKRPQPTPYSFWKPTVGYVAAVALMILSLPLLCLMVLFIKLTSKGPAFYTQRRLGQNGLVYTIYKLRSMYHDCERESGPRWSAQGDNRITPIGRLMRLTHMDELPQLWNVIRGEMSLIGPRPERPEFVPELEKSVPHYRARMAVRPGVTGLAQVLHPADTDLESVQTKLKYDLYYLQHANPLLDFQIMVATVLKVFNIPFHIIRAVTALPTRRKVERSHQALVALSWRGTGYLAATSTPMPTPTPTPMPMPMPAQPQAMPPMRVPTPTLIHAFRVAGR